MGDNVGAKGVRFVVGTGAGVWGGPGTATWLFTGRAGTPSSTPAPTFSNNWNHVAKTCGLVVSPSGIVRGEVGADVCISARAHVPARCVWCMRGRDVHTQEVYSRRTPTTLNKMAKKCKFQDGGVQQRKGLGLCYVRFERAAYEI